MTAKLSPALALATFCALTACSIEDPMEPDETPDNTVGSTAAGLTVDVTLAEHQLTLSRSSVRGNVVTFVVENQGSQTHELWVLETELEPEDLPTKENGSFDTTGDGFQVAGQIDFVAPSDWRQLTVTLRPGSYVLLCNYVVRHGDELEVHFHEGMYATFVVE